MFKTYCRLLKNKSIKKETRHESPYLLFLKIKIKN